MSVTIKGNYFFVKPGQKAYKVASNFTNYLELGLNRISDYYLEAKIEKDEFVINALLLDKQGNPVCKIMNSDPGKTACRKEKTPKGYKFLNKAGEFLIGIETSENNLCLLRGKIFDSNGQIVAEDVNDDFLIYHGPAVFGKSGNTRGMVIE
ncbi:hypothetical protein ACFL02_05445 [Planctomycetota bacterium]